MSPFVSCGLASLYDGLDGWCGASWQVESLLWIPVGWLSSLTGVECVHLVPALQGLVQVDGVDVPNNYIFTRI